MTRHTHTGLVLAMVLGLSVILSANWPHWRGPSMNGISTETGLPTRWSRTENIAWRLAMPGRSGSTPIIWGNHIFLNIAESGSLYLWAVDRAKGTVLWKRPLAGGDRPQRKANNSTPSPVTDGRTVWAMTSHGVLKAFDFGGKELWARDLQKDYGEFGIQYGNGSSPLLHAGALYVQVLHGWFTDDPSYVLRINGADGKTVWRVERPTNARQESPDSYTTPALLRYGTSTEIVISGGDVVTGHDPATGRELWRADGLNPNDATNYRLVASPVVHGELIFIPSRERPLLALRPGGRGDITQSHVAWKFQSGPDVPTPVTDGTYLYSINDRGIVYCLDAKTGATVYGPTRLRPGTYSASPVLAEGRIYVTNEDGLTSVFRSGPTFEAIAENDLGEYTLSSPAMVDGQIFLRTDGALYAIGQRRTP
jgi:outer membrane protein assembly factor BamB